MTTTLEAPASPAAQPPPPRPRYRDRPALVAGGLGALTAVLRFVGIGRAQPISVDEMFYMNLGHSVYEGRIPPNFPVGEGNVHKVFLLHPPGFFMLEALWEVVGGRPTQIIQQVIRARELNGVIAVVTVVLIFFLVRRIVGTGAAVAAGLVFALDPFIIRQNGQALLETSTVMWVIAGLLVLMPVVQGLSLHPYTQSSVAGLLFGCALLSKDMVAIETLGVLVLLVITQWILVRRLALAALVGCLVPYAIYVVACIAQGYGGSLWSAKTSGFRRVLGLSVSTGFNAKGSPSLDQTLAAQILTFIFSYGLVAAGTVCGLLLLRSSRLEYRLVGIMTTAGAVLLGYSVAFGTIEEQFLYFLILPAILSLAIGGPSLVRYCTEFFKRGFGSFVPLSRARLRMICVGILSFVLVWNGVVWVHGRVTTSDQLAALTTWIDRNIPRTQTIAEAQGVVEFALEGDGYPVIGLGFPNIMAADHIQYVVVIPKEFEEGDNYVTRQSFEFFITHGTVVFRSKASNSEYVEVVKTSNPRLW